MKLLQLWGVTYPTWQGKSPATRSEALNHAHHSIPQRDIHRMKCSVHHDLLLRTAEGDRAAFNILYAQCSNLIRGVLRRKLDRRAELDDALQEVFFRIWLSARSFDPSRGPALPWMVSVANNFAIDQRRRRQLVVSVDFEIDRFPSADRSPEDRFDDRTRAFLLLTCMNDMDPRKVTLIKAIYLEGRCYKDMAEAHGIPLNTLKTRLRRGIGELRSAVSELTPQPGVPAASVDRDRQNAQCAGNAARI